jgi:tetraacyldisaccharide 4'-kinase
MGQQLYRKIISGGSTGPCYSLARLLLWFASIFYGAAVRIRNRLYDAGFLKANKVPVPVISIGNITAGGTGKTPIVIWLCEYLGTKKLKAAVLTRGYKTSGRELSDEPALIKAACPAVDVVVNPDRVWGAMTAIEERNADILLMDDGFQHRRLARDIEIIAIDATCPFGFNKLLPAGLLREPVKSMARVQACVITRSDLVPESTLNDIHNRLLGINPKLIIADAIHAPKQAVLADESVISLQKLKDYRIIAFCGIGNPEAFFAQLLEMRLRIENTCTFDDHHAYSSDDVEKLGGEARRAGCGLMLCTQKDWVKIAPLLTESLEIPFAYLAMKLEFVSGDDRILEIVNGILKKGKR